MRRALFSRSRRMLVLLAAVGLAASVAGGLASASGAGSVVLPLPGLSPTTKVVRIDGKKVLLVVDLRVTHIESGAKLLVSCGCERVAGPIRKSRTATTKTFREVNWVLAPGHAINVSVTKPPAVGRYMVLVSNPRTRRLVFRVAGCLAATNAHEQCPIGVHSPGPGTPVTTTTPTGAAPTGTTPTGTGPTGPTGASASTGSTSVTGGDTSRAVQISVGEYASCAVLSTGGVDCWGAYLGDGVNPSATPVAMPGISGAVAVGADGNSSCALLASDSIDCWGVGDYGQLGDGSGGTTLLPSTVSGITNAAALAPGVYYSPCALLSSGGVDCWGLNADGQLGDGTTTGPQTCPGLNLACSTTPVGVSGITNAIAVADGYDSACALLSGGNVACWGDNVYGELGDGTTVSSATPVSVSGISTAIAIAAGSGFACALLSGGTVDCWGNGSPLPSSVGGINKATALAVGSGVACAVLANGGIDCWGDNENGQYGNGTTTASVTPVAVSGIADARAVAIGVFASCALLSTGDIDCWGDNHNAQLGNGTTINSTTPVPVTGFP